MAKKNAFIERQRKVEDAMYHAGHRVGMQTMQDLFLIALNDPDVMCKVLDAVDALEERYKDAYDCRKAEADVAQEKMDDKLRKIVGDRPFQNFAERYPELKKCKY